MAGRNVHFTRLVERLRTLDGETLAEVSDFIEFVCHKKEKKEQPLLNFLRARALPAVTLEEVRADLATLRGSLSDVVTELRQERG